MAPSADLELLDLTAQFALPKIIPELRQGLFDAPLGTLQDRE